MNFVFFSVLFIFLTGWMQQSCETKDAALNRAFKLKVGQEMLVKEAGIKVTLNSIVEDSRCPTGVNCVWAGNAKISVRLSKTKGDTASATSVELNTYAGAKSSTYEGYEVRLMSLDPYPKDGVKTGKDDYVATLMVCKNCPDAGGDKGSVSE